MAEQQQLLGRVAFVTGAASGISAAVARRLAVAGARVVLADVDEAGGRKVAAGIGGDACFMRLDVASEDGWKECMAATVQRFGALHVLVNGAGINPTGNISDVSFADWRRVFGVNCDGMFLGCKYGVKTMMETSPKGGAIVNITSPMGDRVSSVLTAYSASKAAAQALTKSVALYCAEQKTGIRCNAVQPGTILTPMVQRYIDVAPDPEAMLQHVKTMQPMGRVGEANEVAEAVLFLASDAASFITGVKLPVDGGYLAL